MSVTEVSEQGWFSRIKDAIIGVLVGIVMFLAAAGLLFWNEGRAVYRAQALEEGLASVVSVKFDTVTPANEGKLVHMSGLAKTDEALSDKTFGIFKPNTLKLKRTVEMYQWEEEKKETTEKKTGGKKVTRTTYTYHKVWSSNVISSSSFKESGHDNPGSMRYSSDSWNARDVTLGAFNLTAGQVGDITGWENISPSEATSVPAGGIIEGNQIYFRGGRTSGTPPPVPGAAVEQSSASDMIGDLRVDFQFVGPKTVSIYAAQTGSTFQEYTCTNGNTLMRLQMGTVSAKEMFAAAQTENTIMTWVLRLVGFVLMLIGVGLVFRPFEVMADVIPFIGSIVGMGMGILSFAIAAPSALFVIAIAWIVYRPILGIILFLMAGGIFVGIYKMATAKKGAGGAAPAAAPPVPASDATPPPLPGA